MPPLAARTLLGANTCAAFCWKPFGERREATGLLSSERHAGAGKRLLIISPTYAAMYSSLVWEPERSRHYRTQEGETCACVDGHVGAAALAIISVFAYAACVWFGCPVLFYFFMRKECIFFVVEILIMKLIIALMTHQCTPERQGIRFLFVISFKYLPKSKDTEPISKINTWNKWHYIENYFSSIKLQDWWNVNSMFPGQASMFLVRDPQAQKLKNMGCVDMAC